MRSNKLKKSVETLPHRALLMSAGLKEQDLDLDRVHERDRIHLRRRPRILSVDQIDRILELVGNLPRIGML